MTISIYIITFNEADKISDCIKTALWADEIIVADSDSTDGTVEIAQKLGARVVNIPFDGFGDLRNQAISHCKCDWIFSLDSDERCTKEVRDEVLSITNNSSHDIYRVPRKNFFMGRWIKHSGWYPNFRQPQLFKNGKMSYTLDEVHEGFKSYSKNEIGVLRNFIWQLPFKNIEEVINKTNRYSTLGVFKLQNKGINGGILKAIFHGTWSFMKHYIFKLGFLDGGAGFVIAFGNFEGTFYRYLKLTEYESKWKAPEAKEVKKISN